MIKNLITAWDNLPKRVLDFTDEADLQLVGQCILALKAAMPEIQKPKKPVYCLGRATIEKVADESQLETETVDFVAADDLFHKNPYAVVLTPTSEPVPAPASPTSALPEEKGDKTAPNAPEAVQTPKTDAEVKLDAARARLAVARKAKAKKVKVQP